MTIYKLVEKPKSEKDCHVPEVVTDATEPLTKPEAAPVRPTYVAYHARRSRAWTNMCVVMIALLVLAAGIIGGIYLYRYLTHKVLAARCGVVYYDRDDLMPSLPQDTRRPEHFMTEEVSILDEKIEQHAVERFEDVEESIVLHDFETNYTAISDRKSHQCFVMKLDRKVVSPPNDVIDLIWKLRSGYYMPKASMLRQKYHVMKPPMSRADLFPLGAYIRQECRRFAVYRLEKIVGDVIVKRSTMDAPQMHKYGYFDGHNNKVIVMELF